MKNKTLNDSEWRTLVEMRDQYRDNLEFVLKNPDCGGDVPKSWPKVERKIRILSKLIDAHEPGGGADFDLDELLESANAELFLGEYLIVDTDDKVVNKILSTVDNQLTQKLEIEYPDLEFDTEKFVLYRPGLSGSEGEYRYAVLKVETPPRMYYEHIGRYPQTQFFGRTVFRPALTPNPERHKGGDEPTDDYCPECGIITDGHNEAHGPVGGCGLCIARERHADSENHRAGWVVSDQEFENGSRHFKDSDEGESLWS